jgi:20S proteasome subunit beta 6
MYIVLAKGSDPQVLQGVQGIQEMTSADDGERVFVIRRDLKKD